MSGEPDPVDVSARLLTRYFLLLLTVAVVVTVRAASPQSRIQSLRIEGNHHFTERELLSRIRLEPGSLFSSSQLIQDLNTIVSRYHDDGYYVATAVLSRASYSTDSSAVDLTIGIVEGPRIVIGSFEIRGAAILPAEILLSRCETHLGGYLDRITLERDIEVLLSLYEKEGYPFASARVDELTVLPDSSLRVVVGITEGDNIVINEITVAGNSVTKENVIVREMRLNLPEPFEEVKVRKIRTRLSRLNIFSGVREPELYVGPGGGGLLVTVQEGTTNTFDGVVGYAPAADNQSGTVIGLVNVAMRNLFGTGRKLNVRWQRDERNSQEIGFQYIEPWIFGLPANLGTSFSQRQQDSSYIKRVIDGSVDLLITESFTVGGLLHHEAIVPSLQGGAQPGRSNTLTTGISIRYDSRDDLLSPTSGANYRTEYLIGTKRIAGADRVTVQRLSVDLGVYLQFVQRQVMAIGFHGRQLTSASVAAGDLYRFGGTNSLRGYRENQFIGSRVAWTNLEYRFLLAARSFFYGFFDTGYAFMPADDLLAVASSQIVRYGYGVGIRMETGIGNVGVSLAFGEGDSFNQGKIHFGLVNEF